MKKTTLILSALLCAAMGFAQQSRTDIKTNPLFSASSYYAYPGPLQQKLTPAPTGYKPFYISHYGRHGSRWLINKNDYLQPVAILQRADSLGKLTALGRDILRRLIMIRDASKNRYGELTQRGGEQHRQIAKRMIQNFPEVFAGRTNIDARSTTVIRCIFSMENALQQLLLINPELQIKQDASNHDMYYMNYDDPVLNKKKMPAKADEAYKAFGKKVLHYDRVMNNLFNDSSYWKHQVKYEQLYRRLFSNAANLQSTELRHTISLYDLFSDQEIYNNWRTENAWWYITYGGSALNGGTQPFTQRNLLRNIIAQADSCIQLEHPGATLRYGHDTVIMPLTCLLDLDGLGMQVENLEELETRGWYNYRIFPMAANIQFVFYRKNANDKDVIFKVLRNENEATLPIKTDIAPYYHWKDFKDYFLKKLDSYKE